MTGDEATRTHALHVAIGEARGAWMAARRRAAFRAAYGRDPVFKAVHDPGEVDDFALACRAAGRTETLYALFAYDVRDALAALPQDALEVPRG